MAEEFTHQLTVTRPDGSETLTIPAGTITIGRQVGNDLLLEHPLVSRQHVRLECTAEACHITDLGSSNGTTVDDEKLTPQVPVPLAPGTVVKIGPFQLAYDRVPVEPAEADAKPEPEAELPPEPAVEEPAVEEPVAEGPEAEEPAAVEPPLQEDESDQDVITEEPVEEPVSGEMAAPPPPPPPTPPPSGPERPSGNGFFMPPGLSRYSRYYLDYLPGIYHTEFMSRFLALFESILKPIEWNVDNFDLFLDPETAPADFLPWLANWFELAFDDSWSEEQRRTLLAEANQIYARRGTKWALSRTLEIYTGRTPQIDDQDEDLDPFTFSVDVPVPERELKRALVERIIDMNKPAHAIYKLRFKKG